MPTSGKLFLHNEALSLNDMKTALTDFKKVEKFDDQITLTTDIWNLAVGENFLEGLYSFDNVVYHTHRGKIQATPYTTEAPFRFMEEKGRDYLLVMAPKKTADKIAEKLNDLVHGEIGFVREPVLNINKLRAFYESGEGTKVLLFDEIDIPNMNKLTLYGDDVVQTDLYG